MPNGEPRGLAKPRRTDPTMPRQGRPGPKAERHNDPHQKNDLEIGSVVRYIRVERGLTQQGLASKTSLTVSFLSQLETGKCRASLKVVEKLAAVFDMPLSSLLLLAIRGDERNKKIAALLGQIQNQIKSDFSAVSRLRTNKKLG